MQRFLLILSLVIGAWMLSPTPEAQAWSWSRRSHDVRSKSVGMSVPELDPTAAGGAMILLLGGLAFIASRRREEDFA
ncbi:MAG: hypothetical protein WCE62_07810 [Polyangiales bacterium]